MSAEKEKQIFKLPKSGDSRATISLAGDISSTVRVSFIRRNRSLVRGSSLIGYLHKKIRGTYKKIYRLHLGDLGGWRGKITRGKASSSPQPMRPRGDISYVTTYICARVCVYIYTYVCIHTHTYLYNRYTY